VSDTTLALDRRSKVPLYMQAGIPEVWVVNLQQDKVEVYSAPGSGGGAYRKLRRAGRGQSIPIPGFPDVRLSVDEIL